MSRQKRFASVFGENWVVGRYLLPQLKQVGKECRGILLDLACGESPFQSFFPSVESYIRVDLHPLDADVIQGDMLDVPVESHSIDHMLLFQAISDVPNPVDVLKEAKRVLKPDGSLFIFESMAYPEHDAPHDFYRIMPFGLRSIAGEAGLRVQEIRYLGGVFTRFSSLWSIFLMGGLRRHRLLRPFAYVGIAAGNLVFYGLDRLAMHPRLASDYLAILTSEQIGELTGEGTPGNSV